MPELRFALLGAHPFAKAWYAAIEQSDRHHIIAALASDVTSVPAYDHWQPLAADVEFDAALLFFSSGDSCEAARQLAMRGKGLVIDWECRLPSSLVAEFGLLDAEAAAAIVPLFDWRAFPVLQELRQILSTSRLGDIVLIRIEFDFPMDSVKTIDHTLSEDVVSATLVPHCDTLRWLGGDYSQVTTLRTGTTAHGFAGQTLTLAGEGLPDATCVYRVGKEHRWTCEVHGTIGTASVHLHGKGMRLAVDGEPVLSQDERRPDPELCLRLIDDALQRRPGALRWEDRVRVDEIQEAMQRSLRRRRTIDLHFETTSERSQFKTQMATVGCFVLVYTFLASTLLLLAGAVLDPRDELQRRAEAAGFVIPWEEFEPSSARLSPAGQQHVKNIAARWETTPAVVVVETADAQDRADPDALALARSREEAVRRLMQEEGVRQVDERLVSRPLAGQGFQTVMTIGRVIAFAPVGIFLVMQILLLVARPAKSREQRAPARGP